MAIRKAVIQTIILFATKETDPTLFEVGSPGDIESRMTDGSYLSLSALPFIEPVARHEQKQFALAGPIRAPCRAAERRSSDLARCKPIP